MAQPATLEGKTAIVTGAGNGLGRAEAVALAAVGASVVLNDLPGPAVQAVADEITGSGGQAVVAAGDVAEWATGEALLAAALGSFGSLDILVNNAGVLRDRMVFSMSEQDWDTVLRVHLRGHFVTTRLATGYWREQSKSAGGPVYARIINTSSEAFLLGSAGAAQLRGSQGRHRRADADYGTQLRQVRGQGQRDLPASQDRHDGRADGRCAVGRG